MIKSKISRFFSRFSALCCVVIIVCLSAAPLKAYADNKVYRVDSANFDITLSENGNATITESWNVTYISGSFTRFYKEIFDPDNQLEYFPEINVINAYINGTEATETYSIDRVDYHYYFEKSSQQIYTIHWFKAVQNETVNYEITYEIPNAVKLNENDDALYCYRLIGKDFPKTVSKVNTTVHFPDSNAFNSAEISQGDYNEDGGTFTASAFNVSGMYKLRLNMNAESFGTLGRVIDVEIPDGYGDENNTNIQSSAPVNNTYTTDEYYGERPDMTFELVFSGFVYLILIMIVFAFIHTIVVFTKARNMFKRNPDCFQESAERIQKSGMPYVWYGFIGVGKQINTRYPFYAEIIDLCHKGYLTMKHDSIVFNNFDDSADKDKFRRDMDIAFIKLLRSNFPIMKDLEGGESISFSQMKSVTTVNTTLHHEINSWVEKYARYLKKSTQYKQLKRRKVLKELKPDFEMWKKYAMYIPTLNKVDVQSCFGVLERTGSVNAYTAFQLRLWLVNSGHYPTDTNNSSYYFFDYYERGRRYREFVDDDDDDDDDGGSYHSSRGSSCASCSSCSSCSGCGGGGAD